jgi:hypothetical protein
MTKKKVLLIGIDPKLIDFSKVTTANVTINTATGWDANRVRGFARAKQLL